MTGFLRSITKSYSSRESHNRFAQQIWAWSDQQFVYECKETIQQQNFSANAPKLLNISEVKEYSVSPIYRGRVYRGIGYIAVACWTPFFCPPIWQILQTWCPRAWYFSRNRGNSLHSIRGRQFFAKSAHRDSLLVPVRWRQFFAKSTGAYLSMRGGTHAVRWATTLGGALTPPLCHRVGSS